MSEEMENIYNIKEDGMTGYVHIADEVLAIIAGLAAREVEGVSKLTGNLPNELASRLGKKNHAKGVRIELSGSEVMVELTLEILYDYNIKSVSAAVQNKVKQAIETMTGLTVTEVNIRIAGVKIKDVN